MNTVKKDGEVIIDFLACLHLRSNKTDEMYKCFSYTKQLTAYRVDRFILIHTNSHDYIYNCNRITLSVVLLVSEGSTNETFVCCSCGQLTNRQKKGNRSIHKSAVAVAACVEGGFSDKLSLPFPLLVCKGCAAVVQNAVHMARWGLPSCSAFSKNVRGRNAATEATSVISHRGTTLRDALNKMMEGFDRIFC